MQCEFPSLFSWFLQVHFLLQMKFLRKVGSFFGRRKNMEDGLGDASHIAAALQESGIECEAQGRDRRLISSGDDS